MDPETKALLERSRKRRELLNQRFDNMPKASPRKRAVNDNDGAEKVLVQQQSNEDDSPKRHCKRDVERLIKPDTPAIQGVESRIRDLAGSNGVEDQENSVMPVPVPRKSISSPPLERKALAHERVASATDGTPTSSSTSRKGRFAALAQNINSWEDDLTSHVHKKEDVKSSPTKASNKQGNGSPVKKIVSSTALSKSVDEMKKVSVISSPKKTPAPSAPRLPENNFCRSTPLRASKVELNRSPKPFSPVSSEGPGVTKSSDEVITTDKIDKDSTAVPSKLAPKERKLDAKVDQPAKTPISRFMSPEKRAQTPKGRISMEPSKKPMSAKLAHFEKQIMNNTPRSGLANSARISKLQKQEFTPVPSASVPTPTVSSRPKDCDPSELPISQRMSRIQEKLASSPFVKGGVSSGQGKSQEEPTTYPVGARMSAWENISSSGMVSEVKKVNHENIGTASMTPKNPPPAPPPPIAKVITSELTPQKSFKDSIQQKSNEIIGKRTVHSQLSKSPTKKVSSPVKSCVRSPSKVVHSPSKMSKGTKVVQEQLIKKSKEINTTCGTLAAQSRAARMAELESIQNRWKNGILRDESSSDESNQKADDKVMKAVTPGRREESRNRAREDFASKLSQIEFDETAKASAAPQQSPSVSKDNNPSSDGNKTPSSQTFSIYSLIKKRDEEQGQTEDADKKKNPKVTFHDSFFEDDDENMRKVPRSASLRAAQENPVEPEAFKKPRTPTGKEGMQQATESDTTDVDSVTSSRTSLEIDDDDASLKGFVSEAVRRESTRMIKAPQKHYVRQSSMDSYDDDEDDVADARSKTDDETHPSSTAAGYRPDVESMDDDDDDDDDENDCGAVGELLDEAMMDASYNPDMDPNNVVLRRKPQQIPPSSPHPAQQPAEEYDPDMDINNVVLRRKPRPTNTNSPVAKKTRSHAMAMSTTDDDDDDERPYSLSAYRKSVNVNQHHVEPVVRQSKYQGQHVVEEDIPMPSVSRTRRCKDDTRAVQDRIKELQELVQHEQNIIMQTSNALNKCCVGNAYFAGSAEQVECNRLLLIACQKRQVYMTEIQRLKQTSMLDASAPGPRGSLTISDIRLPLKKDFVKRIGTSHDNTTHFFILLIRNGCQVICTQMLSTHDSMMRGSLDFPNLIKINGIGGDFKLAVDIYGMSVSREMTLKDKKKKTPRKGKGYATALESPGGPMAVRTTSFSHVACVDLNMRCLDKTSFHLDRLPHLSPLYGQIFMRFKCLMESHVEEKGFLTMFDDVSGFGAWHRRWCVLSSNKLCVWKYPDDETRKDPMTIVDLKRCVTEKVGLVPRDICARPNTFEMVTVRQPLKGEHDTLITRTHSTVTTVRHQMSADTKEERIMWCNKINRTLSNLRTWNPDALHPSKQSSSSSSSSSYYH